ncbi:MAG: hypothetical protein ABI855_17935 [Bacteroidota bacterium]
MSEIIDRVESNRNEKLRKVLLFCGIGALVISALQIFFFSNNAQGSGVGWSLDRLYLIGVGVVSLTAYRKLSSSTGQFIEWKSDSIIYKLKGNPTPLTIEKINIGEVVVNINTIEIKELNGNISKLDISDFTDYQTRTKIKSHFESIPIRVT